MSLSHNLSHDRTSPLPAYKNISRLCGNASRQCNLFLTKLTNTYITSLRYIFLVTKRVWCWCLSIPQRKACDPSLIVIGNPYHFFRCGLHKLSKAPSYFGRSRFISTPFYQPKVRKKQLFNWDGYGKLRRYKNKIRSDWGYSILGYIIP